MPPLHPRAAGAEGPAASRPHDLGAANAPWTGIESFQDVTTEAGIAAAHDGSWNEYGGGDFNERNEKSVHLSTLSYVRD